MSTLSPSSANTTNTHPQRAPPPSLFLGPPSRNASNISLSLAPPAPATAQNRTPLVNPRSSRGLIDPASSSLIRPRAQQPAAPATQSEGNRTDALWAEMQATLAEVELSAFSSTHVFGPAHHAALEELRDAQIELARAWGRSEADAEFGEGDGGVGDAKGAKGGDEGKDMDMDDEGEGEDDVVEARRRREANDRFFKKVGEGVQDVVGKLDHVAKAMEKVERESREIWHTSDAGETDSAVS